METINVSDLQEPVDLGELIARRLELSEAEQEWMKTAERNVQEIVKAFGIPAPLVSPPAISISNTTAPMWIIHPKTYDSLKLFHLFPQPTRKLRRVQLRRLYARKRKYRQHRARVNAAIQARLGAMNA
jgi:hypothetical protein